LPDRSPENHYNLKHERCQQYTGVATDANRNRYPESHMALALGFEKELRHNRSGEKRSSITDDKEQGMTPTTAIPITVEPPAMARVEELGMQRELQMMLDYIPQNMPGLLAIHVELDERVNMWDEASVIICLHLTAPTAEKDKRWEMLGRWFVRTFSPDVSRHFARMMIYEAGNGR
jgi:hypothetical protein